MRSQQVHSEIQGALGAAVAKTTPPAIVAAVTGDTLIGGLTILYLALQSAYLAWRWHRDWRKGGDDDRE